MKTKFIPRIVGSYGMIAHPTPSPLPRAWLGYRVSTSGRPLVAVCAWCSDKAEAERQACAAQHDVTHGLCTTCYQRQIAALTGERVED